MQCRILQNAFLQRHHTSSLLAVPISLNGNGFEKVSGNDQSIPGNKKVTNPLLSSSCSKKTRMSLRHNVHTATCCLLVLLKELLGSKTAQFLEKELSCSKSSQMQLMFLLFSCLLLHQRKPDAWQALIWLSVWRTPELHFGQFH